VRLSHGQGVRNGPIFDILADRGFSPMKVIIRSSSLLFLVINLLLGLPVNRKRLKKFWSPVRFPTGTRKQVG
jgi:hypothetical protein